MSNRPQQPLVRGVVRSFSLRVLYGDNKHRPPVALHRFADVRRHDYPVPFMALESKNELGGYRAIGPPDAVQVSRRPLDMPGAEPRPREGLGRREPDRVPMLRPLGDPCGRQDLRQDRGCRMSPRPYGSSAKAYLAAGYWPLPLPPRKKASPPEGYTGRTERKVGLADVDRWIAENRSGNIALRLPPG